MSQCSDNLSAHVTFHTGSALQMLKFTSGKTGQEDVKLLIEANALIPAALQQQQGPTTALPQSKQIEGR